ncbi:hypothetical protein AQJ46_45220 [Streptomyces canus]|uniref:SnoaL-like domain-containing protein n=1 Tax=Streptomyces canus TaxID=58343 RepID=A0A124HVB2_9ACTN|nr:MULTISPECIES: DUF3828 domain-containing protein [Streptomyces]KUN57915.1 hypothetical protein AQJ46_45220 [Streptomyces canus]MDI5912417.1 DUF3828 domain-containing protein [Streptomyces sp. 12257]
MSRNTHTRRRSGRRAAFASGLVLAVGLGVSAQVAAQAAVPAPAPAKASVKAPAALRSVSGFNGDVVTQVADFYGAYIDAKDDAQGPDAALVKALRAHYLTPAFAKQLAAWEKKNKVDGLLRAQNVPVDWTVSEVGNGLDVVVTLTFGGGESPTTTRLVVKQEPTGQITGIRTMSIASAKAFAKSSAAVRSVSGQTGDSVTQVADFYGAYVDAKDAPMGPDAALVKALRAHYLTPAFAKQLGAWEKKNKVDGVLRAQNVPVDWTVSEGVNSGEIVVTHSFGGGESPTVRTDLVVKLEPVFGDVTDIRTTSAR